MKPMKSSTPHARNCKSQRPISGTVAQQFAGFCLRQFQATCLKCSFTAEAQRTPRPRTVFQKRLAGFALVMLALTSAACGEKAPGITPPAPSNAPAAATPEAAKEGERVIQQYLALDKSKDAVMKIAVKVQEADGQSRDLQMTISKKRQADGSLLMLVEFTAPAEERDRNALLAITPQGDIEGTRYIQSNNSFATVKGATKEESLFGLTAQEMADGQPEKYDFRLLGEENVGATPAYKLEGKLKKGADSKFQRIVMLIDKATYMALAAEFYNNKNELMRRVTITKNEQVSNHWTRSQWTIDNLARKKKLEFEVKEIKFNQNLNAALFTREHLKKTAFR